MQYPRYCTRSQSFPMCLSVYLLHHFHNQSLLAMEGFFPKDSLFEFTLTEIKGTEKIFKERGEQSLGQAFFQDIATSFSCSASRAGKSDITWKQGYRFLATLIVVLIPYIILTSDHEGKKTSDLSGLAYEAKSMKDNACRSASRAGKSGKSAITWEQVQSWFQNGQEKLQDIIAP